VRLYIEVHDTAGVEKLDGGDKVVDALPERAELRLTLFVLSEMRSATENPHFGGGGERSTVCWACRIQAYSR
jgi:hypothetical protein